jgi:hypothetical protein
LRELVGLGERARAVQIRGPGGYLGVRQGSTVREVSEELLAALTAAYEEAATGQPPPDPGS